MKRATIMIIGAAILLGWSLMAAKETCGVEENDRETAVEDSIFQKLGDLINGKYVMEVKPPEKIDAFQGMADDLKEGFGKGASSWSGPK
jgi:hypothetical protein